MEQLVRLRKLKGFSQRELAKQSGVSPATIYELENGRREPNPSTLRKLARALEVEVAALLGEPTTSKVGAPSSLQPRLNGFAEEERRSSLAPWAAYARRMADRIRQHADDPHSRAFRDVWAALFFVEEKNREAAEFFFFLFDEEGDQEPLAEEGIGAWSEVLSAFEELAEALSVAQERADLMGAGRAEDDLERARRQATEAATAREQAAARFSARLESRGA